ncbi:MAG: GNAT family N-acetyltransferase [Rivularia sp. (in: cyanobacteria)]
MKIQSIDEKSPYLQEVIKLGDKNRKTLGFLPDRAFAESAKKRKILVAIDSEKNCVGYLLFRSSHNYERVTIAHLCVGSLHRGKGITKQLVNGLKLITKNKYDGIGLHCRNDYGLDNMWSNLGFIPKGEKPGRSKDGKLLTYWWYDYGHPNLFSNAAIKKLESKLCVVIDSQIFFDLYADESSDSKESKLLLADWLELELELCITDGIFIQINNISNDESRKLHRQFAENNLFTLLPCQSEKLDDYQQKLQKFLDRKDILKSSINLHHLARAIVSDSHIFVTREPQLLNIANEIYEHFKLSVIRPINLVIQLDELGRNPEYQPMRLAGTSLEKVPLKKGEEETITNYFYCDRQDETKAQFQQKLRRFLTYPENFECLKIIEGEDKPLALIVYGKHNEHELEIPLIRVSDNPLSATLAQHLIFKSVLDSAREGRQFTIINDQYLQDTIYKAIQEHRFIRVNHDFLKINLAVVETASQLSKRLKKIVSSLGEEYNFCIQLANSLKTDNFIQDIQEAANIERFLFPAKIIDAKIPTFIFPIQPRWAKDLFDEGLANQNLPLFGAKNELAFNKEAVYYRSAKNSGKIKAPFRILWYVSQDKYSNYVGVGAIRACSLVDEVIVDKAENLFQIFQRLGVYKLTDISSINQDENGNIMAIRFGYTELLNKIELRKIQQILNNPKITFQSPYKIHNNIFHKLYNIGTEN